VGQVRHRRGRTRRQRDHLPAVRAGHLPHPGSLSPGPLDLRADLPAGG
jgi:hypothetical protein